MARTFPKFSSEEIIFARTVLYERIHQYVPYSHTNVLNSTPESPPESKLFHHFYASIRLAIVSPKSTFYDLGEVGL
jgi:hypothetical protein